jgi:hypothetical protein
MGLDADQQPVVPPRPDRLRSHDIAARIGALLFVGGAVVTALGTILPHNPQIEKEWYWALAGLQLLAAAIVLTLPPGVRRGRWIPR